MVAVTTVVKWEAPTVCCHQEAASFPLNPYSFRPCRAIIHDLVPQMQCTFNIAVSSKCNGNAGGKTASLKTLGLTAIMAKAGLFIPLGHPQPSANPPALAQQHQPHKQQQQQHHKSLQQEQQQAQSAQQQQQQQQQPSLVEAESVQQQHQQPRLVFFDKVLADVGDSQNLQQSLSTFSGHIRRVRTILQEATPHSLVLLDEVLLALSVCPSVCLSVSFCLSVCPSVCLSVLSLLFWLLLLLLWCIA